MKIPFKNISIPCPSRKTLSFICLLALVFSLIPLLYVGRYAHPTGDDIYYGVDAHLIWESTGSLTQTIGSALRGVAHDYQTWQGTYTAMFLMRLQPTVFSENLYFLTPFLVIGLLLGGYWYLLCQIRKYIIPFGKYELIGIWSVLMILSLQWVISPGEAFYWYNGSVYYSGFYGITMFLFGMLCKYTSTHRKTTLVGILFLEFLVGGSNYLTLLWSMLVLLLTALWSLLRKHPKRMSLICIALFEIACFVVSASAPGNEVRQALFAKLPVGKTILFSLLQGTAYFSAWLNGWWVLGALLLLPFMIPAIGKMKFRFSHPFIVTAFLYGMFCTLSCPTFYAQSSTGPGRVLNVVYYGFVFTSYISLFYLVGWVYNNCGDIQEKLHILFPVYCKLLVLFTILQICVGLNDDTVMLSASVQAMRDIVHQTGSAYDQEYKARIQNLQELPPSNIVLMPYQNRPLTVYVGDYGPAADQGSNQALARWYGHSSIVVDYGSPEN